MWGWVKGRVVDLSRDAAWAPGVTFILDSGRSQDPELVWGDTLQGNGDLLLNSPGRGGQPGRALWPRGTDPGWLGFWPGGLFEVKGTAL